jgi:hypothetical protein
MALTGIFGALAVRAALRSIRLLETALERLKHSLLKRRVMVEIQSSLSAVGTAKTRAKQAESVRTGNRPFSASRRISRTFDPIPTLTYQTALLPMNIYDLADAGITPESAIDLGNINPHPNE